MDWRPSAEWQTIRTIDAHAEGEPLRVIIDGWPQPRGDSVLERRRDAEARSDHLRTALMWEPRGHADMYGCLVMPPVSPEADLSVLFLHNDGYSTMCGHGIIAVSTVAVEVGLVSGEGDERPIAIDTPAGLVRSTATMDGDRVREVRFINVPSFVEALDERVDVPGLGEIVYDLAFGGAYYAYVDAGQAGLELVPDRVPDILAAGRAIKLAIASSRTITHPGAEELGFLYGTIFTAPPADPERHSRHACVFADGELDRSPTGTGVSGRLALLQVREELALGEEVEIESIIGSRFRGRIVERATVDGRAAVVPEVSGRAFITGRHEFLIDPRDPWREGFLVR